MKITIEISIGDVCLENWDCTAEFSECFFGYCRCKQGFKTGIKPNTCVKIDNNLRFGENCTKDEECFYNMVCGNNGTCTCSEGQKSVNDYECVAMAIGDRCLNNTDCSTYNPTLMCGRGNRCACNNGTYRMVYHYPSSVYPLKAVKICIPLRESMKIEGAQCSDSIGAIFTQVCKPPYFCVKCGEIPSKICGRVYPPLLDDTAVVMASKASPAYGWLSDYYFLLLVFTAKLNFLSILHQ